MSSQEILEKQIYVTHQDSLGQINNHGVIHTCVERAFSGTGQSSAAWRIKKTFPLPFLIDNWDSLFTFSFFLKASGGIGKSHWHIAKNIAGCRRLCGPLPVSAESVLTEREFLPGFLMQGRTFTYRRCCTYQPFSCCLLLLNNQQLSKC